MAQMRRRDAAHCAQRRGGTTLLLAHSTDTNRARNMTAHAGAGRSETTTRHVARRPAAAASG